MKEMTKNKRVARRLGLVCFILCLIAGLNGITGCDKNTPIIPYFDDIFCIEIDSAAACCGIDSFYVHAEWLQDKVNEFLKDSVQRKTAGLTGLYISFLYNINGEDYIYKSGYDDGFEILLYDCEGNVLPNKEINIYEHRNKKDVVSVEIGKLGVE